MSFCTKCGKKLSEGSRFCTACGAPVKAAAPGTGRREETYVGRVEKCPACGAELQSFMAFCPMCGHEINSRTVVNSLKDFLAQLDEADEDISKEKPSGFSSWSTSSKVGWIILCLSTYGIPALVLLMKSDKFTKEEERKASVIRNFTVPNERESILEGLLFIRTQMTALAAYGTDRKRLKWARLWMEKARSLYQKAELLFPGDRIAAEAYEEITACEKKISKRVIAKAAVIGTVVFLLVAWFIFQVARET